MYADIIDEHNMRTEKVINMGAVKTREGSEDPEHDAGERLKDER